MTADEIIKTLENISNGKIGYCKEDCSFYDGKVHWCAQTIAKHSLNLINRQKAEIWRLRNKVEMLEIEKQAIKEDSDKSKVTAMGVIKRQDEKIERLKEHIELLDIELEAIKISTVKEFAERLKEKAIPHYFDNTHFAVKVEEIDNLVKEMVGDTYV